MEVSDYLQNPAASLSGKNSGTHLPSAVLWDMYIQGVPGGKDLTSGECSLGQTIPI